MHKMNKVMMMSNGENKKCIIIKEKIHHLIKEISSVGEKISKGISYIVLNLEVTLI
jgi:hypothetical protein